MLAELLRELYPQPLFLVPRGMWTRRITCLLAYAYLDAGTDLTGSLRTHTQFKLEEVFLFPREQQ